MPSEWSPVTRVDFVSPSREGVEAARPRIVAVVLCVLVLAGGCAHVTGQGSGCGRSVEADVATARARLGKGQLDEALLYVEGVLACPGATEAPELLVVAYEVYEQLGRLGEAWSVARRAADLARGRGAEETEATARLDRFRKAYALLIAGAAGAPKQVDYLGPSIDDATAAQLDAARGGEAAQIEAGLWGYWFFPGRYRVEGVDVELVPGGTTP